MLAVWCSALSPGTASQTESTSVWSEETILLGAVQYERLGFSVALEGDTLFAGSPDKTPELGLGNAGEITLYGYDDDGWQVLLQVQETSTPAAKLGIGLDLQKPWAVAGAPGSDAQEVYVLHESDSQWQVHSVLTPPDGSIVNGNFGLRLALDGNRLAVSEPRQGNPPGVVHVYEYEESLDTWVHQQQITPRRTESLFGIGLALDGDQLVASDRDDDLDGTVYVFEHDPVQGWTEVQTLQAEGQRSGDLFGQRLLLDSGRLLISAPGQLDGIVYYFEESGGQWIGRQELHPPPGASFIEFGTSLSVQGDRLVIGAPSTSSNTGAIALMGLVDGSWSHLDQLRASENDSPQLFGLAHDIDGDRIAVGAPYKNFVFGSFPLVITLNSVGAVFVYEWSEILQTEPREPALGQGVAQQLRVRGGNSSAGDSFWILGSVSGTSPELVLTDGTTIPLVPDVYFSITALAPNQPPLDGSLGVLDVQGKGLASFSLDASTAISLAGLTVYHAAIIVDASLEITRVSLPVEFVIAP